MGLYYSIVLYIKPDKVAESLRWLYQNTNPNLGTINISYRGENLPINGDYAKLANNTTDVFEGIDFSTSLLFDIDVHIIKSLADYNIAYSYDGLDNFKERFVNTYQGDGKISIGYFNVELHALTSKDAYKLSFSAVTSDMSLLISESLAVKKWIIELSTVAESLLSFLNLESEGNKIVFYQGQQVEITVNESFDMPTPVFEQVLPEYFALTRAELYNTQ